MALAAEGMNRSAWGPDHTGNGFPSRPAALLLLPHDRAWGGRVASVDALGVTLAVTLGCALVSDGDQMEARVHRGKPGIPEAGVY
jgi:hypothetical protein